MGIFIDGHEVKLPGDKLALRVTAVKQDDGTEINPATSEDIAALTAAGLPFDLRAHLADTFVAISTTAGGATLATLKGAALEATTAFVRIVPQFTTDDIRFSLAGDPTSASPKVPASGLILNAAQAATVKLIAITVAANATLSEV